MDTPLITLLTDFGVEDAYVGVMHAVIHGRCPRARVVDLCHRVMPQDTRHGGLLLRSAWRFCEPGAVHCAVVDPGVGSPRRILAADCGAQRFLAPDNGLLDVAWGGIEPERVVAVARPDLELRPRSATFHGRDVFAPLAAFLAGGGAVGDLGDPIGEWQRLPLPEPVPESDGLRGEVLYVDRFGNAITNLDERRCRGCAVVLVHGVEAPLVDHYGAVEPGRPLAIVGSDGFLEIAINRGDAADHLGLGVGSVVRVIGAPGGA